MGGRPTMVVLRQLRDKTPAGRLYSGEGLVAAAAGGSPVVAPHQGNKTPSSPHAVAEPKFLLPVVVLPEPPLGRTVMAKLINELLLLTCMGAFIASATYTVTLLH
jgi:hypothetical protein